MRGQFAAVNVPGNDDAPQSAAPLSMYVEVAAASKCSYVTASTICYRVSTRGFINDYQIAGLRSVS
jgi:hypothetical protein